MVVLGQVFISIGFLIGAVSASLDKEAVNWTYYAIGFGLGALGVALAWVGRRQYATHADTLSTNLDVIEENLQILAKLSKQLDEEKDDIYVYDMHVRIDELFPVPLDLFVQARESMIHAFSMNDYAELMNHFAAGERGINRVWSASVDGYIDEVKLILPKAAHHFQDAADIFTRLKKEKAA